MKGKLKIYTELCECWFNIASIVMLCDIFYIMFSYEFLTVCILAGIVAALCCVDVFLKNEKYYRIKRILEERYSE